MDKSDEQVFLDIVVQPNYGKGRTLITWVVPLKYTDGEFYIYRSYTGARGDWTLLNENSPVKNTNIFEDRDFSVSNAVTEALYRIALEHPKYGLLHSPVVKMFDRLPRTQFGAVRYAISQKQKQMSLGGGVEILHFIPLYSGKPASEFDTETNQRIRQGNPDDPNTGFGTPFAGGFGVPFKSWLTITSPLSVTTTDYQEGKGSDETLICSAEMLPYPKPARGHLIVHVAKDDRYAIGEKIDAFMFRGVAAVAYNAPLILLNRSDPRYGVPIPKETA